MISNHEGYNAIFFFKGFHEHIKKHVALSKMYLMSQSRASRVKGMKKTVFFFQSYVFEFLWSSDSTFLIDKQIFISAKV